MFSFLWSRAKERFDLAIEIFNANLVKKKKKNGYQNKNILRYTTQFYLLAYEAPAVCRLFNAAPWLVIGCFLCEPFTTAHALRFRLERLNEQFYFWHHGKQHTVVESVAWANLKNLWFQLQHCPLDLSICLKHLLNLEYSFWYCSGLVSYATVIWVVTEEYCVTTWDHTNVKRQLFVCAY